MTFSMETRNPATEINLKLQHNQVCQDHQQRTNPQVACSKEDSIHQYTVTRSTSTGSRQLFFILV
jgi:hypothetical protein